MVTVYASEAAGQYGYLEKPWYQPGARLAAFLGELDRRRLRVAFREPPAARDEDLLLFHTPVHVAAVTARCAADRGSLDRAPEHVQARSRRLLHSVEAAGPGWVSAAALAPTLAALDATLAAFAPFLESEGLVAYDATSDAVRLTDAGRAFLADPTAALGGPTYARAHVERAARHVCGGVLDAVARIASGELTAAFVPIAGFHHARRDEARMYCLYNDAALAVAAALRAVEGPVAYVDVDIHHGDGVYEGFAADPRVAIVDLHEGAPGAVADGAVAEAPFVGGGVAKGTKRAVALGRGTTDTAYLAAWADLERFLDEVRPAFVILEAGVDGLASDPMSSQALTPAVFGEIARRVKALADRHAGGRLLVLGGGGYELAGMAAGWAEVVEGLGAPRADEPPAGHACGVDRP